MQNRYRVLEGVEKARAVVAGLQVALNLLSQVLGEILIQIEGGHLAESLALASAPAEQLS